MPKPAVEDAHHLVGARRGPAAASRRRSRASRSSPSRSPHRGRSGSARATLPMMPPPVTCAAACTLGQVPRASRAPWARRSPTAEKLVAERATRAVDRPARERRRVSARARRGRACNRSSAVPASGSPTSASPSRTRVGERTSRRSTTPSAKPARSRSSGLSTPACSAVSPPSSATPAMRHPAATPATTDSTSCGVEEPDRHVVEQEERLGTDAGEVVDEHRHEVDADGVVASSQARHLEFGADAVGRRDEDGLSTSSPRAAKSPAKRPNAPTTVRTSSSRRLGTDRARRPRRRRQWTRPRRRRSAHRATSSSRLTSGLPTAPMVTGIGAGYAPVRHASQHRPSSSIAARRFSSVMYSSESEPT